MNQPLHSTRKPRVFLSHSKKDVDFIRRLDADLRSCQCDTWIDEIEIRHGRPWLDEIFSAGIPSCEVVLCYVTENSVESNMVRQEIDARLLERLQNDRVALLLYLSTGELRPRLRLDLQRLQAPVLNDSNYSVMLPRIVAEIWRSYAELSAASAAQSERVKRLEAELRIKELESSAADSVFSASENTEFTAIWSRIDRDVDLSVDVVRKSKAVIGGLSEIGAETESTKGNTTHVKFALKLGCLFRSAIATQKFQPSATAVREVVSREVLFHLQLQAQDYEAKFQMPVDIDTDLLKFGLVERQATQPNPSASRIASMMHVPFRVVFTAKFDRFLFWLEHNFGAWDSLSTALRPLE